MSKRDVFIEEVEEFIGKCSEEAKSYFEEFKAQKVKEGVTDKGKAILKVMQEKCELNSNIFKSKEIGEDLGISGRSVSGSIRALVTGGYVEKIGKDPVTYALTETGKAYDLDK